jgi:hypothetical protein
MRKLLILSILIATFWIPIRAAREPNPFKGLRKVRKQFALYCVFYVIAVVYILPRL